MKWYATPKRTRSTIESLRICWRSIAWPVRLRCAEFTRRVSRRRAAFLARTEEKLSPNGSEETFEPGRSPHHGHGLTLTRQRQKRAATSPGYLHCRALDVQAGLQRGVRGQSLGAPGCQPHSDHATVTEQGQARSQRSEGPLTAAAAALPPAPRATVAANARPGLYL